LVSYKNKVQHLCATLYSYQISCQIDYLVREPPDDPERMVLEPPEERIVELDERIEPPALEERIVEFILLDERTEVLEERETIGVVLRDVVAVELVRTVVVVEREGVASEVLVRVVLTLRVAVGAAVARVAVVAVRVAVPRVAAERVAVDVEATRVAVEVLAIRPEVVAVRTLELP
jgi:hypothetical protein